MDTKKLCLEVSGLIQSGNKPEAEPMRVIGVAWQKGETMQQALNRQREKSERIAAKLKANLQKAAA